ncbi:hypothetical protein FGIG_02710 [Fasciola gigantica]|uniref:Uncharacterized protein n=1 Tax=Fasciola gigantica TaxID=46835 RepID=A0A504YDB0_FASGI|nr:hypothetical protein FGIG_02710 [Fasciola gigantica]
MIDVNWDITFLLNRRYDIARADEDFPILIQPPEDGTLYHVPAMRLFPEGKLPPDTFFIHLMFKPRKEPLDRGAYMMAIRDPDGTLRLSLRLVHVSLLSFVLQTLINYESQRFYETCLGPRLTDFKVIAFFKVLGVDTTYSSKSTVPLF